MSIKYVNGDLFKHLTSTGGPGEPTNEIIIPHIVNNIGRWGSGFVVPLAKEFPVAEKVYRREWSRFTLGDIQDSRGWLRHNDKHVPVHIVNMFAQNGIKGMDNLIPLKYWALAACMRKLVQLYSLHSSATKFYDIHAPKFGSDRAGGDWNFIEVLIKEIWIDAGFSVTIYELAS